MIIVQLLHGPGLDSTSPLWDLEAYMQPILGITVSNQPSDVLEWEKDFCIANLSQYIQHSCCTTWYLWLEIAYKNTCFWTLILFGSGRSPPRSCSTTPIFQKLGQIATVDDFVHQDAHASTLSRLVIIFDVPLWFSSTFNHYNHFLLHYLHYHHHHHHHHHHVCLRGCWIHADPCSQQPRMKPWCWTRMTRKTPLCIFSQLEAFDMYSVGWVPSRI